MKPKDPNPNRDLEAHLRRARAERAAYLGEIVSNGLLAGSRALASVAAHLRSARLTAPWPVSGVRRRSPTQ